MKLNRALSYGADSWIDLAEAMVNVSASLEAFENRLLLMFPETEVYQGDTHRRYTFYSSPVKEAKEKLASVYVEK